MSIRKRKWTTARGVERETWICDYIDGAGTRRHKSFAKKKDADAFLVTARVEVRDGVHVADAATTTVKDAGEKWLATCEAGGLERSTLHQYRTHLEQHIVPFIGRLLLSKVTVPLVRSFQDKLRDAGRSAVMVRRVTTSLGSLLADAQERGTASRNAVREMSRARGKAAARKGDKRQKARLRIGVDIPTREEISQIIHQLEGRHRPFFLTAIFTGLRASELRGLRWQDVDFDKAELHVRQRADRYQQIGMPKSSAGQRKIPLPPMVANALKEWKLACPLKDTGRNDADGSPVMALDLAFPTAAGKPQSLGNIIRRGLWPVQIAAGVSVPKMDGEGKSVADKKGKPIVEAKYTGLHALRHFYASWCINRPEDGGLGLPPKIVQDRMGHATISLTMDTYSHLFPSRDDTDALASAEKSLVMASVPKTHGAAAAT